MHDRTRVGGPSDLLIYFSMPDSHKGSQLTAYGGFLRYIIEFRSSGGGHILHGPDVIIQVFIEIILFGYLQFRYLPTPFQMI